MKSYTVLRYGQFYELRDPTSLINVEEMCKSFQSRGWQRVTRKLRQKLNELKRETNTVSRYKIKSASPTQFKQCEGLISKYPGVISLTLENHRDYNLDMNLSITCCKPPHKSKVWIKTSVIQDDIDSKTHIDYHDKAIKLSKQIIPIIIDEYDNLLYEKRFSQKKNSIISTYNMGIETIACRSMSLKNLINKINHLNKTGERFSLSERLAENDSDVFNSIKNQIALTFHKPISSLEEYHKTKAPRDLEWKLINMLNNRSAIFSKRHDKKQNTTYFVGSVYGELKSSNSINRNIVKTVSPYL